MSAGETVPSPTRPKEDTMTIAYGIGTIFYANQASELYEVVAATTKTVTVRQLDSTRELGDGGSDYTPKLGQYIGEEKRRKVSQADGSIANWWGRAYPWDGNEQYSHFDPYTD